MKMNMLTPVVALAAVSAIASPMWISPVGTLHASLPRALPSPGGVVYNADVAEYTSAGWRMETEAESEARESAEEAARHAMPLTFTKRDLCKVLSDAGYLAQFRAVLAVDEQAAFWWDTCVELATDDPDFMAAVEAMKIALGVTDRDVRAICERAAGWTE